MVITVIVIPTLVFSLVVSEKFRTVHADEGCFEGSIGLRKTFARYLGRTRTVNRKSYPAED